MILKLEKKLKPVWKYCFGIYYTYHHLTRGMPVLEFSNGHSLELYDLI